MAWLVGTVLVALLFTAALGGGHAGGHGLVGPIVAVALGVGWLVAVAGRGAASGTAWWLAATCAVVCLLSMSIALPALRYRRMAPASSSSSLVGEAGRAVTELAPTGVVQVRGESWTAESMSGAVAVGSEVRVVSIEGVKLHVWSEEAQP